MLVHLSLSYKKGLIEGDPMMYKLVLKSQDEKWYE